MLVSGAVQQAPRAVALAQAPIAGSGWTPGRRSSLSVTGRRPVRASDWVESGCPRRSDEAAAIVSQFQPADHRRRRHEISGVDPRRTTAKRHAANKTELRIMTCRCNVVVAIVFCSCYYVPKQQHVMSLASPAPTCNAQGSQPQHVARARVKCRQTAARLSSRTRGHLRKSEVNSVLDNSVPENSVLFVRTHTRTTQKSTCSF